MTAHGGGFDGAGLLRFRWMRPFLGRPRLFLCAAGALALFWLLPLAAPVATRALIAWNGFVLGYAALAISFSARARPDQLRVRALINDESRFAILGLALAAAAASFVAIFGELGDVKTLHGAARAWRLTLVIVTIVDAWSFTHLIFAQHYAHEFYVERDSEKEVAAEARGGLMFPGGQTPDFSDFAYFSFVIGVAAQTADVAISTRPMRRVALAHCITAFVFNTTILAMTINIAAGLF